MTTTEERLTRVETTLEHVATKADIARMELRLFRLIIASSGVIIAASVAAIRFL